MRFISHNIKKTSLYRWLNNYRYFMLSQIKYRNPIQFEHVETFCMFLGHGRSGHSIIGALLDAHKHVIISDEADVLWYLSKGFSREQIYRILLFKSEKQARKKRVKSGLGGKTYSYWVPGQWQGRYERLQVIGDSKAGVSVRTLAKEPLLFSNLNNTIKEKIKFFHITRNPYDTISTVALRQGSGLTAPIRNYFNNNCEALVKVRDYIDPVDLLVMRHEDLIKNPQEFLLNATQFIGVESDSNYLDSCASIIYKSPSKTRSKIEWDSNSIQLVEKFIEKYNFLDGYTFSN